MQRGWRLSVSSNNVDCLKIIPCYDDRCINHGVGEANFLGGVASVKEVKGFNPEAAKKRFFEIYLDKV